MKKPQIKRWALSPHSVKRMEERNISLAEISEIIEHPDVLMRQGPKWLLAKYFQHRSDNMIAAVLLEREEKNLWLVITVMIQFEKRP
jgi:hypothetical protein